MLEAVCSVRADYVNVCLMGLFVGLKGCKRLVRLLLACRDPVTILIDSSDVGGGRILGHCRSHDRGDGDDICW